MNAYASAEYTCDTCSFSVWRPIASLGVSYLGLYDDARFPGRAVLVLGRHAESLEQLGHDEANAFFSDLRLSGTAIRRALNADRINYALLGNIEPHLHWHLIPRTVRDLSITPGPRPVKWLRFVTATLAS